MLSNIGNSPSSGQPVVPAPDSRKEPAASAAQGEKNLEVFQKTTDELHQDMDHLKTRIKTLQKRESVFSDMIHYTFWGGALAGVITTLFVPPVGLGLFAAVGGLILAEGVAKIKTYNKIEKQAIEYKSLETQARQRDETKSLIQGVQADPDSSDSIDVGDGFVVIDGVKLEKNKLFRFL